MTANNDIKIKAKEKGICLWEIAERLNINDGNFSRKLRKELPDSEKAEIFGIIESISQSKTAAAERTANNEN